MGSSPMVHSVLSMVPLLLFTLVATLEGVRSQSRISGDALMLYPEQCPPPEKAYTLQQYVIADKATRSGTYTHALSSNRTFAPFSADPIRIEDLFAMRKETKIPRVCDNKGRCIDTYELNATVITTDLGFLNHDGSPLGYQTEFMAYDGSVPGPAIVADMGVQTLIRLHNFINCNTSSMTAQNSSHYTWVSGLTMHHHGSETLSPFDGWASDDIPTCGWKDYVFPNNKPDQANWYHDHSLDNTAKNVGSGLFGSYYVKDCNDGVPKNIKNLGVPDYMVISEALFLEEPDKQQINPWFPGNVPLDINGTQAFGTFGDHITVNGKIWPTLKVQRKPYHVILLNGAMQRMFNLRMEDADGNVLNEQAGRFWVLGSEGSFRSTPVEAPAGLLIAQGERYRVVFDFSGFTAGTEIFFTNRIKLDSGNFSALGDNPEFCYSHLVAKFVVSDDEPWAAEPFNPFYSLPDPMQSFMKPVDAQVACEEAMNKGKADFHLDMMLSTDFKYFYFQGNVSGKPWAAYMGDAAEQGFGSARKLRGGAPAPAPAAAAAAAPVRKLKMDGSHVDHEYLPLAMPTTAWTTWHIYNDNSVAEVTMHPLHLHMMDMFICGRKNNVTTLGTYAYELMSAKDVVRVSPGDHVYAIIRFGPHEGSFMFHCHNTAHEDEGLMAQYNSTYALTNKPTVASKFGDWAKDKSRYYGGSYKKPSPGIWKGEDPLVYSDPKDKIVGHNLYYAASMPPRAMRQDPKNPGRPQPLTEELARKVLARNYYHIMYPDGRKNLNKAVKDNHFAVSCKICEGCKN